MMAIFALGGRVATRTDISAWMKKDDDPGQLKLNDTQLAIFLNGLINEKRGAKEGAQPVPEKRLGNNIIFVKLKIALSLQAEDIMAILELVGFQLSKHELSAFFRKSGHKHYRECKDQVLRNFLHGLQLKYRGKQESPSEFKWPEPKPK
jgi:uncharacterized protein YehS (DUF1456 family)